MEQRINAVKRLVRIALDTGLVEETETLWAENTLLDALRCDSLPEVEAFARRMEVRYEVFAKESCGGGSKPSDGICRTLAGPAARGPEQRRKGAHEEGAAQPAPDSIWSGLLHGNKNTNLITPSIKIPPWPIAKWRRYLQTLRSAKSNYGNSLFSTM